MNLEDRLRVAADAAIGSSERTRAGDGLERLYADYEGRMRNPLQRTAFDDITQNAQFGPAAYALGVHYIVQDKLDEAEYWMRFAAECDIGDAALRLAQLCELRAVRYFNRSDDDSVLGKLSYEHSVEARYWYGRAEAAGYIGGRSGMLSAAEQPTEPLDCCDHLALKNSLREAECVVEAAHEEALAVVRQARRDAQQIVDDARAEVEALATRRSALTAQMAQLRSMLEGLAGLVEKRDWAATGCLAARTPNNCVETSQWCGSSFPDEC